MGTIPNLSDCNPGFEPVEYNVVILPEEVEKITAGGIIRPDRVREVEGLAQVRGLLVAVSPLAFNFDEWPEEKAHLRPKPGDLVIYAKYGGILIDPELSDDGREYRVLKDKDVMAVIRKAPEALKAVA